MIFYHVICKLIIFLILLVYMVDLRVLKSSLDEEGIKDGYVEGNLSVAELTRIITAIFLNQTGDRSNNRIDVSLATELVLNWILNVYDLWVLQIHYNAKPPHNKQTNTNSQL